MRPENSWKLFIEIHDVIRTRRLRILAELYRLCVWLLKQLNTLRRKAAILNAHKPEAQGKRSTYIPYRRKYSKWLFLISSTRRLNLTELSLRLCVTILGSWDSGIDGGIPAILEPI